MSPFCTQILKPIASGEDNMSRTNTEYFPALTGVRAVAAILVYIHHFNPFKKELFGDVVHGIAAELHVGVTLFFVLSGFLIAYRYSEMKDFSLKTYVINRLARIYPMYFILTTLTFLVLLARTNWFPTPSQLAIYFANVTFLRGFSDTYKFSLVSQGWSLTVEEVFYITAPLYFLLLNKSRINFVIIPVALVATGIGLVAVFHQVDFLGFFSTYRFMFLYTFFGRCTEFLIGMFAAITFKESKHLRVFKGLTSLGICLSFACVFALSLLQSDGYGLFHPVGIVINNLVLPLFGVATFYYGLLTETTIVSRILSSRFVVFLGKSSYIFYLIHMGTVRNAIAAAMPTTGNQVIDYLLIFAILQIVSCSLFCLLEQPINDFVRKMARRKSSDSLVPSCEVHTNTLAA